MKNLSNINHELDMVTKKYVDDAAMAKVDRVDGKQLSTNDFTNELKTKLEGLNILQVFEIPTADETNVGNIIQYVGVTNDSYTNGFFYKNENMIWTNIKVQNGVSDYNELENKPTLNGIEINGDKTSKDYGISNAGVYYGTEVPADEDTVFWIDPNGSEINVLTTDNTTEYTPVDDYNPATKKYVDDKLSNIEIPETGLEGYATEEYVTNAISSKADTTYVDTQVSAIEDTLEGKADASYLNEQISNLTAEIGKKVTAKSFTATIPATGWSTTFPYVLDVTVTGISASDNPKIKPSLSTTAATAMAQLEAWNCIDNITTGANKITCTCYYATPVTAIPIIISQ